MPTTQLMIEALVEMRHDPGGISPEHFWQLVERFRADLVNQAFAILGNQQDAEDVAQESLCQAFQDLSALRDPRALGAWLRSINRHNAVRLVRYRRQKAEREERLPTGAQPVERGWQQARSSDGQGEMLERLVKAIDGLAEEYREVVLFRYWEHLSYEEIAARLGVPLGTVKSRLARADRHLFQRLRTTLPQEEAPKKRSASRRSQRVVSED
ncbi:MAG: RNA polymerase sigma factor [Planctomycetes bacterium]|nr:RNA polymerase sigma factor [Planctomycetota bacterium]